MMYMSIMERIARYIGRKAVPFLVLIFHLIISSNTVHLYAQEQFWEQTNGPPAGFVTDMIIDSSGNIFIAAGSIYKFDQENGSWINLTEEIDSSWALELELAKSGRLLFGTYQGDIYFSDDLGASWSKSIFDTSFVLHVAPSARLIVSVNDSILVVAKGPLLFRSTDNGEHWYHLSNQVQWVSMLKDYIILPNGDILIGGNSIHRSTDLGENWVESDSGTNIGGIRDFIITEEGNILAASAGQVLKSVDGGHYWEQVSSERGFTKIVIDSLGKLIAIKDGGKVYKSDDHGISWSEISNNHFFYSPYSLAFDKTERLYAGLLYAGVFTSDDYGVSWAEMNNGLNHALADVVKIMPDNKIFVGAFRTGVFSSIDQGESWEHIHQADVFNYIYDITEDDQGNIFLGTEKGLLLSRDSGATWKKADSTIINDWFHSVLYFGDGIVLAGTGIGRIYRSIDYGETWERVNKSDLSVVTAIQKNHRNELFAVIDPKGIHKSVDEGQTWQILTEALTGYTIRGFDINIRGDLFVGTDRGIIYKLNDGGSTWIEIYNDSSHYSLTDVMADLVGNIYASFHDGNPIVSHDGGKTWDDLEMSPFNYGTLIEDFATDSDNYIYAAVYGRGIIKSLQPVISVRQRNKSLIPRHYSLSQNHPNPFNPVTNISYSLPRSGNVTLVIYSLLGEEVTRLVEEYQPAGEYNTVWNASNVASGIYFYRLQVGDFMETRKMVLLK